MSSKKELCAGSPPLMGDDELKSIQANLCRWAERGASLLESTGVEREYLRRLIGGQVALMRAVHFLTVREEERRLRELEGKP